MNMGWKNIKKSTEVSDPRQWLIQTNLAHEQQSADSERKKKKGEKEDFMLRSWELSTASHTKCHAFLWKSLTPWEAGALMYVCAGQVCKKGWGASHQGLRVLLELLQML